jgi:hypothetical protein
LAQKEAFSGSTPVIHYIVFGLAGPPATLFTLRLSVTGLLSCGAFALAHVILLLPFLICAYVDRSLHRARWWERMIVASFLALILSGIAIAVAAAVVLPRFGFGIGTMVLGLYAAIPCAVCSLLASMSKLPTPPPPRQDRQRPDWG